MSDQPTVNVELAIRDEIAQIAGWTPDMTLDEIGNQLGSLYGTAQQVGDENTMQIVSATWNQVQALATQGAGLLDIAAATKASLEEAIEQHDALVDEIESVRAERDQVKEELEEIEADLDDPFEASNWKISSLVEEIQESEYEYAHDSVREDIIQFLESIGLTWKQAMKWCGILVDGYRPLSSEDRADLFEVLNRIVPAEESKP